MLALMVDGAKWLKVFVVLLIKSCVKRVIDGGKVSFFLYLCTNFRDKRHFCRCMAEQCICKKE